MATPDLLAYILDETSHVLAPSLAQWIEASSRFKTFIETHRDKIRKKIRVITDEESLRDLQAELEVAYLLLLDRRFTVEYEKYVAERQRGPDFSVTFKTRLPFNVEVKRLRASNSEGPATEQSRLNKIVNAVCSKLSQMPPSMINLLFLNAAGDGYAPTDLAQAMRLLEHYAGQPDGTFLLRQGFTEQRTFSKYYGRLSGIFMRNVGDHPEDGFTVLWRNGQARHRIPPEISTILLKIGRRPNDP